MNIPPCDTHSPFPLALRPLSGIAHGGKAVYSQFLSIASRLISIISPLLSTASLLLSIASLFLAIGCSSPQEDNIIFSYRQLPDNSWDRQEKIRFPIDSITHSGLYRLSVALRTTSEVPFQKVAVVVEESFAHPHFYRRDTIYVSLTDTRGNIEGHGLVLYNYVMPDSQALYLHRGQKGSVGVSHIMRRMQLDGIRDIGIRIDRIHPPQ